MPGSCRAHRSRVFIPPARLPAMLFQDLRARLGKFTVPIQRIFQYNVSNWIREMLRSPFLHRRTYDSISGRPFAKCSVRCFGKHNANSKIVGRSTI